METVDIKQLLRPKFLSQAPLEKGGKNGQTVQEREKKIKVSSTGKKSPLNLSENLSV